MIYYINIVFLANNDDDHSCPWLRDIPLIIFLIYVSQVPTKYA